MEFSCSSARSVNSGQLFLTGSVELPGSLKWKEDGREGSQLSNWIEAKIMKLLVSAPQFFHKSYETLNNHKWSGGLRSHLQGILVTQVQCDSGGEHQATPAEPTGKQTVK